MFRLLRYTVHPYFRSQPPYRIMNASGISFKLYQQIDDQANEWVLKAFMNSFVNVVEDIKKKDSIETNRVVDYLYTKMLDSVEQDDKEL